jgi:hypothetical protein
VAVAYGGARLPDVTICAGLSDDRKTASMLMSNFGPAQGQLAVTLRNLPLPKPVQVETLAVDATHEFAQISEATLKPGEPVLALTIPGNTVYLVRLRPVQR